MGTNVYENPAADIIHVTQINNTESSLTANLDQCQIGVCTDTYRLQYIIPGGTAITTAGVRIPGTGFSGFGTISPSSFVDIEKAGTTSSLLDILELTNSGNAASMTDTRTAILFKQYYYNASTPAAFDAGRIICGTEGNPTSTAGTQDTYMAFQTGLNGTLFERMRINSDGNVGIRTTSPSARLDVYDTALTGSGTFYGIRSYHVRTDDADGGDDYQYNIDSYIELAQSDALYAGTRAIRGQITLTSGTVDTPRATTVLNAILQQDDGILATSYGSDILVDLNAGSTTNNIYGSRIFLDQESGHSIDGDLTGQYIIIDSDGTVTGSVYALRILSNDNVDWNIYSTGSPSYFDKIINIGTTTTTAWYSVNAGLRVGGIGRIWATTTVSDSADLWVTKNWYMDSAGDNCAVTNGRSTALFMGNSSGPSHIFMHNEGTTQDTSFSPTAVATLGSTGLLVAPESLLTTTTTAASSRVHIWDTGTASATLDMLRISNDTNAASMADTKTGILFRQKYYDVSTPAFSDIGRIVYGTESNWTSNSISRSGYFSVETVSGGTLSEKLRVNSAGTLIIGSGAALFNGTSVAVDMRRGASNMYEMRSTYSADVDHCERVWHYKSHDNTIGTHTNTPVNSYLYFEKWRMMSGIVVDAATMYLKQTSAAGDPQTAETVWTNYYAGTEMILWKWRGDTTIWNPSNQDIDISFYGDTAEVCRLDAGLDQWHFYDSKVLSFGNTAASPDLKIYSDGNDGIIEQLNQNDDIWLKLSHATAAGYVRLGNCLWADNDGALYFTSFYTNTPASPGVWRIRNDNYDSLVFERLEGSWNEKGAFTAS